MSWKSKYTSLFNEKQNVFPPGTNRTGSKAGLSPPSVPSLKMRAVTLPQYLLERYLIRHKEVFAFFVIYR